MEVLERAGGSLGGVLRRAKTSQGYEDFELKRIEVAKGEEDLARFSLVHLEACSDQELVAQLYRPEVLRRRLLEGPH